MENGYNLYEKIYNMSNLLLAWRKARRGKTKRKYVIEFEKDVIGNLFQLHEELKNQTYKLKPLITSVVRDPKSRKISKSDFRDRIVHHAIILVIEKLFEKSFVYDSCANRKNKGNLFAIKRFQTFQRKVSKNFMTEGFCLKADIKHYFQEVNHEVLLNIIKRKIRDEKVIWLIEQILANYQNEEKVVGMSQKFSEENFAHPTAKPDFVYKVGMPLGNLTSQFFANIYLHDLDFLVKQRLRAKYYIRYVDDFVILHENREQLEIWKKQIEEFLRENLKLELHKDKSKVINLSNGIDFVGFRNFYHFKLLRKRNKRKILYKIKQFQLGEFPEEKFKESLNGWWAHAKWANSWNLTKLLFVELKPR